MVGEGGNPYHSGVGLFDTEKLCMGWDCGSHPLPFILGEDVASAVLAATEKPGVTGHCYNLAGDVRFSAREYVEALGNALGRPLAFCPRSPSLTYYSELAKWGIGHMGGRKSALPSKRDLLSRAMAATLDCTDAKAALGWTPVADRETFLARGIRVHANSAK
jgi:nucleoside-diphosphate-sugar epimerase